MYSLSFGSSFLLIIAVSAVCRAEETGNDVRLRLTSRVSGRPLLLNSEYNAHLNKWHHIHDVIFRKKSTKASKSDTHYDIEVSMAEDNDKKKFEESNKLVNEMILDILTNGFPEGGYISYRLTEEGKGEDSSVETVIPLVNYRWDMRKSIVLQITSEGKLYGVSVLQGDVNNYLGDEAVPEFRVHSPHMLLNASPPPKPSPNLENEPAKASPTPMSFLRRYWWVLAIGLMLMAAGADPSAAQSTQQSGAGNVPNPSQNPRR